MALDWAQDVFGDEAQRTPEQTADKIRASIRTVKYTDLVGKSTFYITVAASEIIANALGRGRVKLPKEVDQWVGKHGYLINRFVSAITP